MVFDVVAIYMDYIWFNTFHQLFPDFPRTYYLTKYKEIISFRQSHYCVTNIIYFAQSSNKPISTIYHCKNIIKPNDKVLLVQSPINLTPYAPSSHISLVVLFTLTDCLKYNWENSCKARFVRYFEYKNPSY